MVVARKIPEAEWSRYKSGLHALYVGEDKTLDQVMNHAAPNYKFYPSRAQYIRQFKKWGFEKNLSKDQWKVIAREIRKRKSRGRDSEVLINNQRIPDHKLRKEMSRYAVLTEDDDCSGLNLKDLRGIIVRTPQNELGQQVAIPEQANSITSTAEKLNSRALILLAQILGISVGSSDRERTEELSAQLNNYTIEMHYGGLATIMEKDNSNTRFGSAYQLFCCCAYLSSNDLLSDTNTDKLVKWTIDSEALWDLETHLELATPTTEIFESNILVSAARVGAADLVRCLIARGVAVNAPASLYPLVGPLEEAVGNHHLDVVQLLLDAGADPKLRHEKNYSILHSALDGPKSFQIVQMLINKGADINDTYDSPSGRRTLLISAAERGDLALTRFLLKSGAQGDGMVGISVTALQASAKLKGTEVAQALIDAGVDVDATAGQVHEQDLELLKDEILEAFTTPIQRASMANNTELVQILVSKGADVNACPWQDYKGNIRTRRMCLDYAPGELNRCSLTALQAAATNRNVVLVLVLLMANAKVDARRYGDTPLQIAARIGDANLVGILLRYGAAINAGAHNVRSRTALQAAASTGDRKLVQQLRDAGAYVNAIACHTDGRTALQAATETGNFHMSRFLLEVGANVNASASPVRGRTCLQAAAEQGHAELVSMLLDKSADVNGPAATISGGLTALQAAVMLFQKPITSEYGTTDIELSRNKILQTLLDAGADPNAPTSQSDGTSVLMAAAKSGQTDLARVLFQGGLNFASDNNGKPAVREAVISGFPEMVSLFIKAGADVNKGYDSNGEWWPYLRRRLHDKTLLEAVALTGNVPIARILLDAGAEFGMPHQRAKGVNPDTRLDHKSKTPLGIALLSIDSINLDILSALLDAGASPNGVVLGLDYSSLAFAARYGKLVVVQLLLKAGASVNSLSDDEETVLQKALRLPEIELTRMLLNAGADVNNQAGETYEARTALQRAAEQDDSEIVELLLSHGADVNAPAGCWNGVTALQGAAIAGQLKIVLMLLRAGAKINAPRAAMGGRTALDGAAENGRLDVVRLLLKNDDEPEILPSRRHLAATLALSKGHRVIARILREYNPDRESTC